MRWITARFSAGTGRYILHDHITDRDLPKAISHKELFHAIRNPSMYGRILSIPDDPSMLYTLPTTLNPESWAMKDFLIPIARELRDSKKGTDKRAAYIFFTEKVWQMRKLGNKKYEGKTYDLCFADKVGSTEYEEFDGVHVDISQSPDEMADVIYEFLLKYIRKRKGEKIPESWLGNLMHSFSISMEAVANRLDISVEALADNMSDDADAKVRRMIYGAIINEFHHVQQLVDSEFNRSGVISGHGSDKSTPAINKHLVISLPM